MTTLDKYQRLLQKLIDGSISSEERRELEIASLDDPFLADALEGYYDNTVNRDSLEDIIPYVIQKKSINLKRVLLVAASFIFLMSISFWIMKDYLGNPNQTNEMFVEAEGVPQDPLEEEELMVSLEAEEKKPATITLRPERKESVSKAAGDRSNKSKTVARPEVVFEQNVVEQVELDKEDEANVVVMNRKKAVDMINAVENLQPIRINQVIGQVSTMDGAPMKGVDVIAQTSRSRATTNFEGNFVLDLKHDDNLIIASFSGYDSQAMPVQTDMSFNLRKAKAAMSQASKSLQEMMSNGELIQDYDKLIKNHFRNKSLQCSLSEVGKESIVKLHIYISGEGGIENVLFLSETNEDCRAETKWLLQNLANEGSFGGKRKLNFIVNL